MKEKDSISIDEKEEYLEKNLIEKGFEENTFKDYLRLKRGEETDIYSLSIKEIETEIQDFIQSQNSEKKQKIGSPKKEEENNENTIKENEGENKQKNLINEENEYIIEDKKENEIKNDAQNKTIDQKEEKNSEVKDKKDSEKRIKYELKKEIKKESLKEQNESKIDNILSPEIYGIICPIVYEECKVLENTPLSSLKNLVITVSSPEKIQGGFLTKSYINYLITTNEINLNVKRRYSDFDWLHQTLLNLYPYLVIPPIPKKNKIGVDNLSDEFISKRMRYLEKFLNWLVANPVIKNSQLLYDFLSIEKDEEFNKSKLSYQKIVKPMNLIEFYHKDGKMNLRLNKEKEEYFKKISDYNNNHEILLNNLTNSLKQLKVQFDIFIQKMEDVQLNWEVP